MSAKKRKKQILQQYKNIKKTAFDFDRIARYFAAADHGDALQVLPDNVLKDLDFEELFMYLDRTCSNIGQQYLYATLRTVPKTGDRCRRFEKTIRFLDANPDITEAVVLALSRLNKPGAYFIQSLIYGANVPKPAWFWVIPLLSGLSIAMVLGSFVFPVLVPMLIPFLCVNLMFHLWNKGNVLTYSNSIPQLQVLHQVAKKFIDWGAVPEDADRVRRSNNAIGHISRMAFFYRLESRLASDIGQAVEYVLDLMKATFLIEPLLLFNIIGRLSAIKADILEVFVAVARVDVALSIASFRGSLPYYTIPQLTDRPDRCAFKGIYHPLTLDPVANDLDLSGGRSVLISGSNMSGKTTFIRTVGINALLSQTIHTACAGEVAMPRMKVHSAIRIQDDLLEDTSYYYEEVKRIKAMIGERQAAHHNLFLLDELFKGTNTVERVAAAKAVLSYLHSEKDWVIASTHDLELTELLSLQYDYCHFSESVENGELIFDYRLKAGTPRHTNAIQILEIHQFPREVTEEAKKLAGQIKYQIDR